MAMQMMGGKYKSNFPKGTPKSAKAERILAYIQNVWSKKPIQLKIYENGKIRHIQAKFDPTYDETGNTPTDASKIMGGNRHGTSAEQRVTLDLADDYYQIASEAEYNYSKDEIGKDNPAHEGVSKWHYFINDIYFAEYDSDKYIPYRVSINIKERTDGEFVYSFSAEKQEKLDTPRTLHAVVNERENSNANVQLSNNRLSQDNPTVNSNSMQDNEKYSENTKDSITVDIDYTESDTEDFTAAMRELTEKLQSGELSQSEFMYLVDELYGQAQNKNGNIPKGEKVTGKENFDMPVPKRVTPKTKVGRYARTVVEGGQLTEEMLDNTKRQIYNEFKANCICIYCQKTEYIIDNGGF